MSDLLRSGLSRCPSRSVSEGKRGEGGTALDDSAAVPACYRAEQCVDLLPFDACSRILKRNLAVLPKCLSRVPNPALSVTESVPHVARAVIYILCILAPVFLVPVRTGCPEKLNRAAVAWSSNLNPLFD